MAITTVNPRYEGFIFDGENSRDYGIYVQNVKVFGAPTRDVEMISIPGRDGEFALDKGRFNNIQVVYTCAFGTDTQTDFNTGVSDFRNWLASRKGYKRLEDEINTAEYRMAVFKDGLDVSTLNKETGTFEVTFDCKPQRFLKSGETAVTVTSGGTLTNPTLFEAKPLIEAEGYGNIFINDGKLVVYNIPMGEITLPYTVTNNLMASNTYIYSIGNTDLLETGDTIRLTPKEFVDGTYMDSHRQEPTYYNVTSYPSATGNNNIIANGGTVTFDYLGYDGFNIVNEGVRFTLGTISFVYGTQRTTSFYFKYVIAAENVQEHQLFTSTIRDDISVVYDGADTVTITISQTFGSPFTLSRKYLAAERNANEGVTANSTQSVNGTIYFDLDVAEAYIDQDGTITSANNIVEIPAVPPALESGSNVIMYDNTITSLKVTPRWWEV